MRTASHAANHPCAHAQGYNVAITHPCAHAQGYEPDHRFVARRVSGGTSRAT